MAETRPSLETLRKRVHVGCGPKALKSDWLNVDIRSFPGIDYVCDIAEPWGDLKDVEYVYGEHFLEHLSIEQAIAFLHHAHGAMKKGGRIRLSTPSVEWVLATHFDPSQTDPARMIAQTIAVNRAFHGWGHQFLWSREMLKAALTSSGFRDVTFHSYGKSSDPFLTGIEEHGDYKIYQGLPSVWIVEAVNDPVVEPDSTFVELVEQDFIQYVRAGH